MIKILFFGRFSETAKPLDCAVPDGVSDIDDLAGWISAQNPAFAALYAAGGHRVSLNQCFTHTDAAIKDGDEIAFMSALSGG